MTNLRFRWAAALVLAAALAGCGREQPAPAAAPGGMPTAPAGGGTEAATPAAPPASEVLVPAASAPPGTFPGQGTAAAGNPADQAVKAAASQPSR
jgi:hypothetical protein